MRATDFFGSCFGDTQVENLAFFFELFQLFPGVFDWDSAVDTMLVVKINRVELQVLERFLDS